MNHYKPRLTLKQIIEHIKYAKLEHELKPMCKWVDFYDYLWSYGSINWKNKIILDIGADIGSSALFFLMNGAKFVYLVENNYDYNHIYFHKMKTTHYHISEKYPVIWNTDLIISLESNHQLSVSDILKEVKTYPKGDGGSRAIGQPDLSNVNINKIDILKMDCEGCEIQLLTEELLNNVNEFVVGLHKPPLNDYQFEQKKKLLEKHGGKYFGNVNNEEFVWIKRI
jgi:FkbM family methyltransferase